MLKFLLAAALLGAGGGAGGGAILASLHAPPARVQHVTLSLSRPGGVGFRIGGGGLAAGDRMQRPLDLSIKSSYPVTALTLDATAAARSGLVSDARNGLQLMISRCPRAWRRLANRSYACPDRVTPVLTRRPALSSHVVLRGLTDLQIKATAHLLVTLSLPGSAPNALQGKSARLTYRFTAVEGR